MEKYFIKIDVTLAEALKALVKVGSKCLIVVDNQKKLLGSLSDGDVRRAILNKKKLNFKISSIYNKKPIIILEKNFNNKLAENIFLKNLIDLIPVVDVNKNIIKVIIPLDVFGKTNSIKKKQLKSEVIIMAGGLGKRLEPFTQILPKPLMPINNKPIIKHIIDKFREHGLNKYTISVNYKSKILKAFFEEQNNDYKIKYIDEIKPLGTVGCLSKLKAKKNSDIFLTNCDIIIDCDYYDLMNFHKKNKNLLTIVASTKTYSIPYGDCKLNSSGKLEKFEEKPEINLLANTGFYILNEKILKLIPKNQKYDVNELIEKMISKKLNIGVFPVSEDSWIDIGNWDEYKKALNKFKTNEF
tara:strand:+ start:292 stop:1356 length:1065 start_codon:yes stop_codon:yes gene_type:complete